MIGIYTQNKNTLNQLIQMMNLYDIEEYNPDHCYELLLWLDSKTKIMPKNANTILFKSEIDLPMSREEWLAFIQTKLNSSNIYENDYFQFDAKKRTLFNKKTNKWILLTEKENDFLDFLVKSPKHQADRNTILNSVWQYSPDVQTHTLESHLYTLKQKLGDYADTLIQNNGGQIGLK